MLKHILFGFDAGGRAILLRHTKHATSSFCLADLRWRMKILVDLGVRMISTLSYILPLNPASLPRN